MRTLRVPRTFYSEHEDRDPPTPKALGGGARYGVVAGDDPALADLIDDARFYAHVDGPDMAGAGLRRSALATVKAIEAERGR